MENSGAILGMRWSLVLGAGWLVVGLGCGGDGGGGGDADGGPETGPTGDAQPDGPGPTACDPVDLELDAMPALDGLTANRWNEIAPGGKTRCADGSEFKFYVFPGSTTEVMVDFMGGGACWNSITCKGGFYAENVEPIETAVDLLNTLLALDQGATVPGLFDHTDPTVPTKDYTHVVIPYCTGDVHWGNNIKEYGEGDDAYTIYHVGSLNTGAVMKWIHDNITAPEQVFTTGCSAGAYGAIMWSTHLANHYEDARHVVWSDSGTGVVTPAFFENFLPNWKSECAFPTWVDGVSLEDLEDDGPAYVPAFWTKIANHYPEGTYAQFNHQQDNIQADKFYVIMGGAADWPGIMRDGVEQIAENTTNFNYYIASGTGHCANDPSEYNTYDTKNEDGVALSDWVEDLLEGNEVDDVTCTTCPDL